ncbi:hypothetical protein SAMN05421824_2205 [Hyunsoonleella jejuensis]|uniref:Lipocalin-like domain-containing protein n=1 Tax=Hyunsoonleella jejuensis TaxID=419940 RepID=A0A1H9IK65_9FLAO|nr:hypothetical protein [Hyunsoonleella jejuensis]SEQ74948.1 hypothetical protein SAMN05421824_2205 [Hyunsoonleella jejuensis]
MNTNAYFTLMLLIVFTACNKSNPKTTTVTLEEEQENISPIIGVWERTSFYNYDENGKVVDSFASNETNRHIKIFTPTKVMWCRNISTDSTEWFGYGNYTLTDSLLTETLEYGSLEMSKYISKNPAFVFHYDLEDNKYSQIMIDSEGHPLFAENYVRIE